MTDKDQAALDSALAQIDRAFGKDGPGREPRAQLKVWMDPFTELHLRYWLRAQVESYAEGAVEEWAWEAIFDDMDKGEHRILDRTPLERMYPPVTIGERVGFFFRRLFGRFQRSEDDKITAEVDRICRDAPPKLASTAPLASLDNPPF